MDGASAIRPSQCSQARNSCCVSPQEPSRLFVARSDNVPRGPARRTCSERAYSASTDSHARASSARASAKSHERRGNPGADEQSREVPVAVIKQRVSNLVQGSLCLVLLTKQFLHATNLSPQGRYTFSSALLYADMPRTRRDRSPLVRGGTANLSAGLMMLLLLKLVYGPQWALGEHHAEDPLFPHDAHTVDQPASQRDKGTHPAVRRAPALRVRCDFCDRGRVSYYHLVIDSLADTRSAVTAVLLEERVILDHLTASPFVRVSSFCLREPGLTFLHPRLCDPSVNYKCGGVL